MFICIAYSIPVGFRIFALCQGNQHHLVDGVRQEQDVAPHEQGEAFQRILIADGGSPICTVRIGQHVHLGGMPGERVSRDKVRHVGDLQGVELRGVCFRDGEQFLRRDAPHVKMAVEDGDGSRGVLKAGFHAEHDCEVQVPEMGYLGQEFPVGIIIDEKIEYCLPGLVKMFDPFHVHRLLRPVPVVYVDDDIQYGIQAFAVLEILEQLLQIDDRAEAVFGFHDYDSVTADAVELQRLFELDFPVQGNGQGGLDFFCEFFDIHVSLLKKAGRAVCLSCRKQVRLCRCRLVTW